MNVVKKSTFKENALQEVSYACYFSAAELITISMALAYVDCNLDLNLIYPECALRQKQFKFMLNDLRNSLIG